MSNITLDEAIYIIRKKNATERIAEIDAMFEAATYWGSWMVTAANEREALATEFELEHKWLARISNGGRTS